MDKIEQAVETYLAKLYRLRSTGGATAETSFYSALEELLNAIGNDLKPKVFCLSQLADQGAGHPDFGLFTAAQCQRGQPRPGNVPERGVVEVKPLRENAWFTAETSQVSKYWGRYRFVVVTNFRSFLMIGEDRNGNAARLEAYQLAATEQAFWDVARTAQSSAKAFGKSFGEYLRRALTQSVPLREPKDVAWFLASHARDALARVEAKGTLRALATVRNALEQALGVRFEGEKGKHFFRSTLVQTLFYGVFSAWVLWAKSKPAPTGRFDWRTAVWHLNVPMIRALFAQLSEPGRLRPLDLVEVLDWTEAALNRVEQSAFFARFQEAEAVEYFYEPFLEAFDPELRKQLGVWYTPREVVTYMVERIDRSLRDDLEVEDGLAAENVYILDPCCGTGSFLAAVLRRISATLEQRGYGALVGQLVKKAAIERVFGFELLPAPFVVAHLQVGLRLQALDVPLSDDAGERAAVYLTNALTGWEPERDRPPLPFPELAEERERAEGVKREKPILVILGNPPYNGYAGVNYSAEELALTEPYRRVRKVRPPEGQGLNDLYVRFFRMAERRIVERTGRGIVCFISNYSWLDGLSFTGMRERFLDAFDVIRIANLHGDRIISEYAPDGRTSETIFAMHGHSPGIKIGTAVALLTRRARIVGGSSVGRVMYRDFHCARAVERRAELVESLSDPDLDHDHQGLSTTYEFGLPFKPIASKPAILLGLSSPSCFRRRFRA